MSPIENLEARLAKMQRAFDDAPDQPASQFDPPPDGDYQTLLHEFDFFEGGQPKQAYMKMRFQVVHDTEYAGRFAETVFSLEDPDRFSYLKSSLKTLGADVENFAITQLSDPEYLASLLDTPTLIRIKTGSKINPKTGQPYVGVYIEQRLGDPPSNRSARDLARREDLPEKTGASDVPGAKEGEFEHPAGDEAPWTSEQLDEARLKELQEMGCECDDPLEVDRNPGTGSMECAVPGHAQF